MGAFKLGNMTFGSLFKKPETVLYPVQKKAQPAGLKGHIVVEVEKCILCGMCERSCPTDCIVVDKAEAFWQIDRFACIQCGYCTTVCPKDCLHMHPDYAAASVMHASERVVIPKQEKPKKQASAVQDAAPAKPESTAKHAAPATPESGQTARNESVDEVLEAKLSQLDPEKVEKVRAALASR